MMVQRTTYRAAKTTTKDGSTLTDPEVGSWVGGDPDVGRGVGGTVIGLTPVGKGVGLGVGDGVGLGVGDGVGLGVGDGVGLGVGDGVGLGVGDSVGMGVGAVVGDLVGGSSFSSTMAPKQLSRPPLDTLIVSESSIETRSNSAATPVEETTHT